LFFHCSGSSSGGWLWCRQTRWFSKSTSWLLFPHRFTYRFTANGNRGQAWHTNWLRKGKENMQERVIAASTDEARRAQIVIGAVAAFVSDALDMSATVIARCMVLIDGCAVQHAISIATRM
jgi:hypothetical protein